MDERDELTLELTRDALEAVSPDEVPLIDAVGPELLAAADAGGGKDGSLGFGVVEMALSTAAIYASRAVVTMVEEIARDVAADEAAGFLRKAVKTVKARRAAKHGVDATGATPAEGAEPLTPILSPDDIQRARTLAYDRAVAAGIDNTRAGLADAIAGSFRIAV